MDEAAFLPEAQQCYDTVQPVAKQIIAVSSAEPGWFGDMRGAMPVASGTTGKHEPAPANGEEQAG